jgi:ATP-dependent DNA helicase RecG
LENFIRDGIVTKRPVPISILREKDVQNYPYKVLRELMMNAVMHRDYQANMPTRLYQYDHHIEIMNPGGLYGQARPENFPHVNDYRNSVVAEMMKNLNYVNMFNHGVSEVQDLLKENQSPAAEFNVNLVTAFSVIVRELKDDNNANVVKDVVKDVVNDVVKELTDRQQVILKLLALDPTMSAKAISEKISEKTSEKTSEKFTVTDRTIESDLAHLKKIGILTREGGRKDGKWVIVIENKEAT